MNVRSDSILAGLTQSQLADLFDWILACDGYAAVQTRAAKPVAEGGLGLNIHITTLTRFYASYSAWLRAQEIADGERDPDSSPDRLHITAAGDLALRIHDLARGPLKPADVKLVAKYLQQQRDHALKTEYLKVAQRHADLAAQKQKLGEDRHAEQIRQFEFCAAREVMKAYVAYQEIDQRTDIDEIDKIWEARKVAYGPRADETPKPPRSAQIHAALKTPLRTQNSGLRTEAQRDTQIHAVPENPLGPPGSSPASAHSHSLEKSTQIHAAPKTPLRTQNSGLSAEARRDTQIHAVPQTPLGPPASAHSLSLEKSAQIHAAPKTTLSPQSSSLSPEAQRRPQSSSLGPELPPAPVGPIKKTPAQWLQDAKNETAMASFFLHDVCNGSSDRFEDFMKSSKAFAMQPDLLKKLGEIP